MLEDRVRRLLSQEVAKTDPDLLNSTTPVADVYGAFNAFSTGLEMWCKDHLDTYADPSSWHATIMYSKDPVDFIGLEPNKPPFTKFTMQSGGIGRELKYLGDSLVLLLGETESIRLHNAWKELRERGASWDFSSFMPHITLSTNSAIEEEELFEIKPYRGPIVFSNAYFEALHDDLNLNTLTHYKGKFKPRARSFKDSTI